MHASWPCHFICIWIFEKLLYVHQDIPKNVHKSIICKTKKLKTQLYKSRMQKWIVLHLCSSIWHSSKSKLNTPTFINIGESQKLCWGKKARHIRIYIVWFHLYTGQKYNQTNILLRKSYLCSKCIFKKQGKILAKLQNRKL